MCESECGSINECVHVIDVHEGCVRELVQDKWYVVLSE